MIQNRLMVASTSVKPEYAQEIAEHLDQEPVSLTQEDETVWVDVKRRRFRDGELYVRFIDSIRGSDLFIIAPLINRPDRISNTDEAVQHWSVNDSLAEANIMLEAAASASAARRNIFAPYLPYSRQERRDESGEPISARSVINTFQANGVSRIMAMDLHAPAIQGFTNPNVPFDRVPAKPLIKQWIKKTIKQERVEDIVLVSPDAGRTKVVEGYADTLYQEGFPVNTAGIEKRRLRHGEDPQIVGIQGNVRNRRCIILDDMISTGGTTIQAANAVLDKGARRVDVVATHGLLAGEAVERLRKSQIGSIALTDVLLTDEKRQALEGKLVVIETAKYFAELIRATHRNESLSNIYATWGNGS